jgi:poly-beta-1,6-N-acetyl-D-glucosamine synthase
MSIFLQVVFWFSLGLIVYVYAGYPALIAAAAHLCSRSRSVPLHHSASDLPLVTILIPAHNEERWIARKIENTLTVDYPRDRMQILIASDGSTDDTVRVAQRYAAQEVEVADFPERAGKTIAINRAVARVRGEILCITDANALLDPDAVRLIVEHFADPDVGGVAGNRICMETASVSTGGESLYWRYEAWMKGSESAFHSSLGAYGQLFAIRQRLFPYVPAVSDDFSIPMKVVISTGSRFLFEPRAGARIPAATTLRQEWERKVRSHVALLYDVAHLKQGLNPRRSPIWWQFWSHHILRLFVPLAMIFALLVSPWLWRDGLLYRVAILGEIAFCLMAALGMLLTLAGRRKNPFYPFFYFVFSNTAILVAWLRRIGGKDPHAWKRTDRAMPPVPSPHDSAAQN